MRGGADSPAHRRTWRAARDGVDTAMTDADKADLECILVIPYVLIAAWSDSSKTREVECFPWRAAVARVFPEAETNLTLN